VADIALENAEKARDALAAEINSLQQQIESKRKELERVKSFIDDYMAFSAGGLKFEFGPPPQPKAKKGKKTSNPDRQLVGEYAEAILRGTDRPMLREDLFASLKQRGVEITGKDPLMVFSTMMWRMRDRFVRLQGQGYWLANEPCPAAGYYPIMN
jgi:hypothetical protein